MKAGAIARWSMQGCRAPPFRWNARPTAELRTASAPDRPRWCRWCACSRQGTSDGIRTRPFCLYLRECLLFHEQRQSQDTTQTDATIGRGAILLVASERIVGLADTRPIAVTHVHAAFHQIAPGHLGRPADVVAEFGISETAFLGAAQLARDLGLPLDPAIADILGSLL